MKYDVVVQWRLGADVMCVTFIAFHYYSASVPALIIFLTMPKKNPGAAVTTSNDIGEKAK